MRPSAKTLLAVLVISSLSAFCQAQCVDSWESQEIHCVDENGGQCYVDVQTPGPPSEYGVIPECSGVDCCGQLVTTCEGNSNCVPELLRRADVRGRLKKVAADSDVLVADCKGQYVPYAAIHTAVASHRSNNFINDHILR
jgi:hypothetical protein